MTPRLRVTVSADIIFAPPAGVVSLSEDTGANQTCRQVVGEADEELPWPPHPQKLLSHQPRGPCSYTCPASGCLIPGRSRALRGP